MYNDFLDWVSQQDIEMVIDSTREELEDLHEAYVHREMERFLDDVAAENHEWRKVA